MPVEIGGVRRADVGCGPAEFMQLTDPACRHRPGTTVRPAVAGGAQRCGMIAMWKQTRAQCN